MAYFSLLAQTGDQFRVYPIKLPCWDRLNWIGGRMDGIIESLLN